MTDLTEMIKDGIEMIGERMDRPLASPDMNDVMYMTSFILGIGPNLSEDEIKAAFKERFGEWPTERVYYEPKRNG